MHRAPKQSRSGEALLLARDPQRARTYHRAGDALFVQFTARRLRALLAEMRQQRTVKPVGFALGRRQHFARLAPDGGHARSMADRLLGSRLGAKRAELNAPIFARRLARRGRRFGSSDRRAMAQGVVDDPAASRLAGGISFGPR